MFLVENNNIIMTKGDSGKIKIKFVNKDGTVYAPQAGDVIVFSVRRKKETFCPVVLKKTGAEIVFEATDTENIPAGEYVYDVVIEKSTKERHTTVEGKFEIRKAVHDFE